MTSQKRAQKGGEYGANGEWYGGGSFIATTDHAKRKPARQHRTGRRQIEPGVWAEQPAPGARSIFQLHVGCGAQLLADGTIAPYPPAFERLGDRMYNGRTLQEIQEMCDRYNAGERWF